MAQAEAVIVRIIRQKFRIALRPGDPRELAKDAEDTAGQARLKLLKRLRSAGSPDEIRDIDDYAALAAQTAYVDFLREKYRNWFGLRDRLRYLLDETKEFAVWRNSESQEVAGLAGRSRNDEASRQAVDQFRENPSSLLASVPGLNLSHARPQDYRELLHAIFRQVHGYVPVDDLVAILGPLLGATDFRGDPEAESVEENSGALRVAPDPSPEDAVIARQAWAGLWREICALQQRARIVFLLHFSRAEFEGFQLYQTIASPRDVSRVIALTHEQYGRLWPKLELRDEDLPALELVRSEKTLGDVKFLLVWKYLPLSDIAIAVALESTPNAVRKLRSVTRSLLRAKCAALFGLREIQKSSAER